MDIKGHGTIKKSKAYGTIGTLLLSGLLLASVNAGTVKADENTVNEADTVVSLVSSVEETTSEITVMSGVTSENRAEVIGQKSNEEIASTTSASERPTPEMTSQSEVTSTSEIIQSETSSTSKMTEVENGQNHGRIAENQSEATTVESSEVQVSESSSETMTSLEDSNSDVAHDTEEDVLSAATGNTTTEVTSVTLGSKGFELQYNGTISANAKVLFAVWSDSNGQDDLVWYTASQDGKATANYTGTYGTYHIHTYQSLNNKMTGLNATDVTVQKPDVAVAITQTSDTLYKVTVSNVPAYITSIILPTWTSANDQDDIVWYNTSKNSDGTYSALISVAEHNLESGQYNVHVYGTSAVTNSLIGLYAANFRADYIFGDVPVTSSLSQTGINISMPSDVSKALTVYHAVWSEANGQDDIVWYKVNDSGQTTASYTGSYGTYYLHTYAVVKGKMVGLSAQSITVDKPNVSVTVAKASDTSIVVTVSDVPSYITSVVVPTWTTLNNQDDIKWYNASKSSEGTYSLTIYAKNHNFESGHYNIHVYGQSQVTGSLVGLAATSGIDLAFSTSITNPTVTVQNYDATKGTLQVVVAETETSKDIASVAIAAWSEADQKNIHWYTTSDVVSGKVTVTVDERYHHNISSNYTIHAYVKTTSGDTLGYVVGTYALNNTISNATVSTTYTGTGIYAVSVSGVYSNGTVKYAVWSDTNDQDDIIWYDAKTSGTNATGLIDVSRHTGTGIYHVHVYQSDNDKMYFLASTDFTVDQANFDTPYYNQRDSRWGSTRFGYYTMASTGCAPTSLAMVISALTHTEILPTTVASYLYDNTVEFNRGGEGTTGRGVMMAAEHWRMAATTLTSLSSLTKTLQEGHHVLAAVEQDKFSPWGYGTSHEIVLKGYSNGNTYVYDPYNASNNSWYPIASLWNEQSTQKGDVSGLGAPFVKVIDI